MFCDCDKRIASECQLNSATDVDVDLSQRRDAGGGLTQSRRGGDAADNTAADDDAGCALRCKMSCHNLLLMRLSSRCNWTSNMLPHPEQILPLTYAGTPFIGIHLQLCVP